MGMKALFDPFANFEQLKITKPIRLIELFAGVGAQAMALRDIGANFEHYRVCEFDKFAMQSYNAIHGTSFPVSDIRDWKGHDLGIVDKDKYEYILTYSFPCTSLSTAGKQLGMSDGTNTASSLLWEVKRLLQETNELPQILLMENVPQVHADKFIYDFNKWCDFLKSLGYTNKWHDLSATDYGIPQTRTRCFMVSVLDKLNYNFPNPIHLEKIHVDYLEKCVKEENYSFSSFSKRLIDDLVRNYKTRLDIAPNLCETDAQAIQVNDSLLVCQEICKNIANISGNVKEILSTRTPQSKYAQMLTERSHNLCGTLTTVAKDNVVLEKYILDDTIINTNELDQCHAQIKAVLTSDNYRNFIYRIDGDNYLILVRNLTALECWRFMGFTDEDFNNAVNAGVSNYQLCKQAGNSIVKQVLMAIFKNMNIDNVDK